MATIVLSAAGQVLGGPIGGAIGAMIGQQIDARIFAPKARHGPRLGDLAVQTSSYGSQIPKIFGTMRVAGTVIWATDLREEKSRSGGGKGRPKTVEYCYSASFAVLLSGRPIRGVGRIWADGKLLRGPGGRWKAATGFRLYLGSEDQPVDPLIASAEGAGAAPAYRGLAYAVFENLELADFGNRIPSLSFEVEAEPDPGIGSIAEALSGGEVAAGSGPVLTGYAATGDSIRGAIEALSDVAPLSLIEAEGRLSLTAAPAQAAVEVGADEGGAGAGGAGGRTEMARAAADSVPAEVSIAYYEPERDYQTGLQRAARGEAGLRADRRALPAALGAGAAKALAEQRLAALWAGRARAKLSLPWRRSGLRPGAHVRLPGKSGLWKVERWSFERMVVLLDLVAVRPGGLEAPPAAPGRPAEQPDLPFGETRIRLLDLPVWEEAPRGRPLLLVAAAGTGAGWRSAALSASFDGGASWSPAGRSAGAATMGRALTVLGRGGSALLDLERSVEVELLHSEMWLESRSDPALAGGANLAALGDELIQFGDAEPLGGGRFRLSRLLRGRRGTEWAAGLHSAGESFVLVEPEALTPLEPPGGSSGGEVRVVASGLGDDADGAAASLVIAGEVLRPPSPVHLRAEPGAGGEIALGWVRRSRSGWHWSDGADAPLGEEAEAYRLTLSGAGFFRSVELTQPAYSYSAAEQAADGSRAGLVVEVVQLGTSAPSRPARLTID